MELIVYQDFFELLKIEKRYYTWPIFIRILGEFSFFWTIQNQLSGRCERDPSFYLSESYFCKAFRDVQNIVWKLNFAMLNAFSYYKPWRINFVTSMWKFPLYIWKNFCCSNLVICLVSHDWFIFIVGENVLKCLILYI